MFAGEVSGRKMLVVAIPAFFLFVVLSITLHLKRKAHLQPADSGFFRITTLEQQAASLYDPAKMQFSSEYFFLENIYSPLVEYSPEGELVSGAAEQFGWQGNTAYFVMRKNLYTIDGQQVDAKDVEMSLKRLMIIKGKTNNDLKELLCPTTSLRSIHQSCPALQVSKDGSTLFMKFSEKKVFLFPMLSALHFAIIPRKSMDPKTLAIKDYRNTSGPYYVQKDDNEGRIELAANPLHFHYSSEMPQKVLFIPTQSSSETIQFLKENKADHATTTDNAQTTKMLPFAKDNGEFTLHATYPLKLHSVVFTKRGRLRLSEQERIIIGQTLRSIFISSHKESDGFTPTEQIFPVFGEGALTQEQIRNLHMKLDTPKGLKIIKKRMLAWDIPSMFTGDKEALKRYFPNTRFIKKDMIPGIVNYKKNRVEEPDFYFNRGDMGFHEDIGLLSYYSTTDFFYFPNDNAKAWLKEYILTTDKQHRLAKLRQLHYETIFHANVCPIAMAPYTALLRKPWVFGLSKIYAGNPLWLIRRN